MLGHAHIPGEMGFTLAYTGLAKSVQRARVQGAMSQYFSKVRCNIVCACVWCVRACVYMCDMYACVCMYMCTSLHA